MLLALPALVESGLLRISRKLYGEIGPAFYGLRTRLLTLLFMALLRIERPEQLKEQDPVALGRLLGLDRAPEVKTLRRKLTRLAAFFKYMREAFLLDALVDYRIEAEDPTRTVPNPERRALDQQIRSARSELAAMEREYARTRLRQAPRNESPRQSEDCRNTNLAQNIGSGMAVAKSGRTSSIAGSSIAEPRAPTPAQAGSRSRPRGCDYGGSPRGSSSASEALSSRR